MWIIVSNALLALGLTSWDFFRYTLVKYGQYWLPKLLREVKLVPPHSLVIALQQPRLCWKPRSPQWQKGSAVPWNTSHLSWTLKLAVTGANPEGIPGMGTFQTLQVLRESCFSCSYRIRHTFFETCPISMRNDKPHSLGYYMILVGYWILNYKTIAICNSLNLSGVLY